MEISSARFEFSFKALSELRERPLLLTKWGWHAASVEVKDAVHRKDVALNRGGQIWARGRNS